DRSLGRHTACSSSAHTSWCTASPRIPCTSCGCSRVPATTGGFCESRVVVTGQGQHPADLLGQDDKHAVVDLVDLGDVVRERGCWTVNVQATVAAPRAPTPASLRTSTKSTKSPLWLRAVPG